MAITLSSIQTRVKALLMDSGSLVWDTGTLTEAVRLALGEYALANQAAVSLDGLDGAALTSLNPLHESLIVWGAAACAALARAVDRAESGQLGPDGSGLRGWGDQRLKEFKAGLAAIFPSYAALTGSGQNGSDTAKTSAEIALLTAQSAALTGQESRAQAAANLAAAERAAEQTRLNGLRTSPNPPWLTWPYADDAMGGSTAPEG